MTTVKQARRGFRRHHCGLEQVVLARAGAARCEPGFRQAKFRRAGASCCDTPPEPPDPLDLIFWFKPDVGVTMNGANHVNGWADQTANHYDVANVAPDPVHWPVWTDAVLPSGLPMLDWGQHIANDSSTYVFLERILSSGDPAPLKTLGARTILAVVKPDQWFADPAKIGGIVVGLPGNTFTYDVEMFTTGGHQEAAYDGGFFWQLNPLTNYKGVPIVVAWEWPGAGSTSVNVYVNGVLKPGFYPGGNILRSVNNVNRLDIGFDNGPSYTGHVWSGMIGEIMCYAAVDTARTLEASAYLAARAGL